MRFLSLPWHLLLLPLLCLYSLLLGAHNRWVVGATCLEDQRLLLLQFKQTLSFSFAGNTQLASWNSSIPDCCFGWDGVTCNQAGEVTGLDLINKSITGTTDGMRSLFGLRHLERLNLSFNNFSTIQIPSGFGNLTNLTHLNLSNSGFSGQIPVEISRLTKLVVLDLSTRFVEANTLKLENPDLKSLVRDLSGLTELRLDGVVISKNGNEWCQALSSSLPKLQILSLSNCNLSGPFDSSLSRLQSLSEIWLAQNNIIAEVPEFFGNFSNLTALGLNLCQLKGKFPESIFQLPKLKILDLSINPLLQGSLPEFSQDSSLHTLVLSMTSFRGRLPDSIGNLKFLSMLKLFDCGFNGPIPDSMKNLNQLLYLDLASNNLTGPIPPLSLSDNLTVINLSHNHLSGPLTPFNPASLQKLVNLNLRNNSLNGSLPSSLFTLPSLQKLDLSHNQFTGPLGDFTLDTSSLLDTLDLSLNKLEGPIPDSMFKISSLKIILLSSNRFNGTLKLRSFERFGNLSNLDLSGNLFAIDASGISSTLFPQVGTLKLGSCHLREFPDFLRNQSKLSYLDLSNNGIGGKIPAWIDSIGNGTLTYLNLSVNSLESPEKPFSAESFRSLGVLDLRSNLLKGQIPILLPSASVLDYSQNNLTFIPSGIGFNISKAIFFSLSRNNFSGQIPKFLCGASFLQVLDLSYNGFSGSIPPCLGGIGTLRVLNLRRNQLSGNVDLSFQEPCALRTIDLNNNRLEGEVSKTLRNCTMLEVLNLGHNQLTGTFPCWLGNLTQLRVLVLGSNHFQGPIGFPESNGSFPMLQIIDLSSNKFTGNVPMECLLSWKAMRINEDEEDSMLKHQILRFGFLELSQLYYQDSVTVRSKGLDMELVKILTVFTSVDLSDNRFEGVIPEQIGDLKALYVLNLSRNALSGHVPSSLGKLKQLESLDLSRNNLSGLIPSTLTDLTFLSVLDLSFNNLVGKIPYGSQFRTFSNTSFVGNDGLCGLPLPNCPSVKEAPAVFERKKNGSKSKEFDWEFIATGIGYGAGTGIIVGPLLFWRKGRKWYDQQTDKFTFMILSSFGFLSNICNTERVEAEERMDDEGESSADDEEEGIQRGRYCVFCTKLDTSRKRAIHNPECTCHASPINSS